MKDAQGNLVVGRTSWRRFAAVMIPAGVIVAGMFTGVAAGAVPISLNVSGQQFKVSADRLEGTGFAQYPAFVVKPNGEVIPVAASAIDEATLVNLCQSVKVPNTGISLIIRAGRDGKTVTADDLLIGLDNLQGDATFSNIDIGTDASKLTLGGGGNRGSAGDFGQQAERVVITGLRQTAFSTHAGTFTLAGLNLAISLRGEECFTTNTTQS